MGNFYRVSNSKEELIYKIDFELSCFKFENVESINRA